MKQPEIIASQDRWNAVSERLRGTAELSLDTESNSMHAFRGRICLIQLAADGSIYLLDPLEVTDLSALGAILADVSVTKVMHGADYDLRCFFREYGFEVRGLFDTEICARFCGMVAPNLAATLRTYLEVDIPKSRKLQRSNWALRPLTTDARNYAAADVLHLVPLAVRLRELLGDLGRLDWVTEEFARMERAGAQVSEPTGAAFLRVKGSDRLDPQQLSVLKALFELREAEAERVDRPPYQVMSNDSLLQIAREPLVPLEDVPGLAPQLVRRSGSRIRAEVQRALLGPGVERPRRPAQYQPPGKTVQGRLQQLKNWRSEKGAALGLDPALVWPAVSLERMARDPDQRQQEFGAAGAGDVRAWQAREFAVELEDALARALEQYPRVQ